MSTRAILGGGLAVATLAAVATAGSASAHIGSLAWGCDSTGKTVFVMNTYHGDEGDNGFVSVDGVQHAFTHYGTPPPLTNGGSVVINPGYEEGDLHWVAVQLSGGSHVVFTGGSAVADDFGTPRVISTSCGSRLDRKGKITPRTKVTKTVSVPRTPPVTKPPVNRPTLPPLPVQVP